MSRNLAKEIDNHDKSLENYIKKLEETQKNIHSLLASINKSIEKNVKNINIDQKFLESSNIYKQNYYDIFDVSLGIISDKFLYESFNSMCKVYENVTLTNYKNIIEMIDILIITSTWHGLKGEWIGLANKNSNSSKDLLEIISYAKSKDVKVIFYSIEDPPHYNDYLHIAKCCDYVFTSALEMVDSYKNDCKNENVFPLRMFVNPLYHSPIGHIGKKENSIIFAGSWYDQYPKRNHDAEIIFDGVIRSGKYDLKIIDRNFKEIYDKNSTFRFPYKYLKYCYPAMQHNILQDYQKKFDLAINLNSVQYSKTMCAMRAYELQAIGVSMISNYNQSIHELFPNIFIEFFEEDIKNKLFAITQEELYVNQLFGIRNVFKKDTNFVRFSYMLNIIGLDSKTYKAEKSILVVVEKITKRIKKMFDNQSYNNKQLIEKMDNQKVYEDRADFVTFWDQTSTYKRYYLEDMINGFKYTDADFITKDCYLDKKNCISGVEFGFVGNFNPIRTVFNTKVFKNEYDIANKISDYGFSIDKFEYNTIQQHKKKHIDKNYNLTICIIVNENSNGSHLLWKSYYSIKLLNKYDDIQILIINYSEDLDCKEIIYRISENDCNVKVIDHKNFNANNNQTNISRNLEYIQESIASEYFYIIDEENQITNDFFTDIHEVVLSCKNEEKNDCIVFNVLDVNKKETITFNEIHENNILEHMIIGKSYLDKHNINEIDSIRKVIHDEVISRNASYVHYINKTCLIKYKEVQKMKYLIVTEKMGKGGLETQIHTMYNTLRNEVDFYFVSGNWTSDLNFGSSNIYTDFSLRRDSTTDEFIKDVQKLVSIIKDNSIDLLIVHPFFSLFPSVFAAKIAGIPVIYIVHGITSLNFFDTAISNTLFNYFLEGYIDKAYAVSDGLAMKYNFNSLKKNCNILYNGISNKQFHSFNLNNNKVWAFITRLDYDKYNDFSLLLENIDKFDIKELIVVGDGEAKDEIEKKVGESNVSTKISFVGWKDNYNDFLNGNINGVIGLGRVVLESSFLGIPTLVLGYEKFVGLLDKKLYDILKQENFNTINLPSISAEEVSRRIQDVYENDVDYSFIEELKKNFDSKRIWEEFKSDTDNIYCFTDNNILNLFDDLKKYYESTKNNMHSIYDDFEVLMIIKKWVQYYSTNLSLRNYFNTIDLVSDINGELTNKINELHKQLKDL